MNKTEVLISTGFAREIKRLRQKYRSVIAETKQLIQRLEIGERPGDKLSGAGFDAYKVRIPNKDANRGKSGGFRVIYFVQIAERIILITIYSKSEQTDIEMTTLQQIIQQTLDEQSEE